MKKFLLTCDLCCVRAWSAVGARLSIQETLDTGSISGVARSMELFCLAVPSTESAAIAVPTPLSQHENETWAGACPAHARFIATAGTGLSSSVSVADKMVSASVHVLHHWPIQQ